MKAVVIREPGVPEFIAQRDSFYLATAHGDGQPYIQLRDELTDSAAEVVAQ